MEDEKVKEIIGDIVLTVAGYFLLDQILHKIVSLGFQIVGNMF